MLLPVGTNVESHNWSMCREWHTVECLALHRVLSSSHFPWGSGNYIMKDIKEEVSSRRNGTDIHMNSQRLWQHGQGMHRSKIDGLLAWTGEVDALPYPQPRCCLQLANTKENCFAPIVYNRVYKSHFRKGPMASSRWPAAYEPNGMSWEFAS